MVARGLLDTSVLIAREVGRPMRDDQVPDAVSVSTITLGELRAGVLVAPDADSRDRRLGTLAYALGVDVLPVDDSVAAAWSRLRVRLRDTGRRMPVNDSWIAATAMALDVPVVTQDDDYDGVPGLDVIRV